MGIDKNEVRNGSRHFEGFGKQTHKSLGVPNFNIHALHEALCCVLAHGDAILLGQTRSGRSWTVTLFQGNNKETAYANNSEELNEILAQLLPGGDVYPDGP